MKNAKSPRRSILISGASIAGPTLAYWLHQKNFDVTVVERAASIRGGGYPIDLRGPAIRVAEKMGVLSELRRAHINRRCITFVDEKGHPLKVVPTGEMTGDEIGDIELPRGDLTSVLYGLTKDSDVHYQFNDSIQTLAQDSTGVDVIFESGERRRFDYVIGADGLHSKTRSLVFGPIQNFERYLGRCFALFSVPNFLGLSHEGVVYAEVGRMAAFYAVKDQPILHGILCVMCPRPSFSGRPTFEDQRAVIRKSFASKAWEVPRLLDSMMTADDLFFDSVSQIRMPKWSSNRVALVGDSAHAPSFLSGQGTSLAFIGAYILAGELGKHDDPTTAFSEYERIMRPFVEANQDLATSGGSFLLPATAEELDRRNRMFAGEISAPDGGETRQQAAHRAHNALMLPEYSSLIEVKK